MNCGQYAVDDIHPLQCPPPPQVWYYLSQKIQHCSVFQVKGKKKLYRNTVAIDTVPECAEATVKPLI